MTWSTSPVLNPRQAFNSARSGAAQRGIPWLLSYDEWWQLWRDHWSRKASQRLALARYADWGPYERDNCRVTTDAENTREKCEVTKIVTEIANEFGDLLTW